MKFFYKPYITSVLTDLLMLLLSFYVVLNLTPTANEATLTTYAWPMVYFTLAWFVLSYAFKRYKPLQDEKYYKVSIRLLYVSEIIFMASLGLIKVYFPQFSGYVLLSTTIVSFLVSYLLISLYYAYRFAVEYREIEFVPDERLNAKVKPANPLDKESYDQLCNTILNHSGKKALQYLLKKFDLSSGNTFVYFSVDPDSLQMQQNYLYSTVIQLERLNDMRNVNRRFAIINDKLPDNGIFVCCFESKSTRKKEILGKHIKGLNYLFYTFDFFYKRVMPKIVLTKKLYYFISQGKNRIFSKTEIFGRLFYCGFKVIGEKKIDNLTYVVAQREKHPEPPHNNIYGSLIGLRRVGKDGKAFKVYKMRTMHPYSEYLQGYIYEKNNLKEGGKFKRDYRVTTLGGFMRKYWLDELPMIYNLLRGDMKLVGVRPLSNHFYSLYSKELQQKRNKFKPGLLPPFYADMPKTLSDIENSEMKYLIACEKRGVFITDLRYLFLILNNILIKKARSG
ncbi:MAG: sugar transferase [Paludibacter sp.]